MKAVTGTLIIILLVVGLGSLTGFIGFRYPKRVENQTLLAPVKVVAVEDDTPTLEDGRSIDLGTHGELVGAGEQIDIEVEHDNEVALYANREHWLCGTPWARPVVIPLIAEEIPRYHRECFGRGTINTTPTPDKESRSLPSF